MAAQTAIGGERRAMGYQGTRSSDLRWGAALMLLLLLMLAINPIGFLGGGWDDWQYLNAARCWAEHGPCLPTTHWNGRWPVFAPIALLFYGFGESRFVLGLWPLVSSIAALLLLAMVGNRIAGRPVGWLAAITILLTPAFSIQILDPSVEALELALVLAGALMLLNWRDRHRAWTAFASGLLFGLAFQVRETAVVATAFAAIAVLFCRPRPRDLLAAAAGFLTPLVIELLVYWQLTGDPLYRRHLSLAHTQIPSSELRGSIDAKHGPFFNLSNIAHWRHEPGVHIHWLIDGMVNLFVNGKAGLTLLMTPVLLLFGGRAVADARRGQAWRLYGAGLLYMAVIIYALAMDPKARVMLVPLSMVAIAFSIALTLLYGSGRKLIAVVTLASQALIGVSVLWIHQRTAPLEAPAAAWIAAHPGEVMVDVNTRATLTLVPGVDQLPDIEGQKAYWLYSSIERCRSFVDKARFSGPPVIVVEDKPISTAALVYPPASGSLCLLKMSGQSVTEMREAVFRSREDGPFVLGPHFNRYQTSH